MENSSSNWPILTGSRQVPLARKGFGSRLIERSLGGYLGRTSELLYESSGLIFRHRTTLADVQADCSSMAGGESR